MVRLVAKNEGKGDRGGEGSKVGKERDKVKRVSGGRRDREGGMKGGGSGRNEIAIVRK